MNNGLDPNQDPNNLNAAILGAPVENVNTGAVDNGFSDLPSDPTDPTDLPDTQTVAIVSNDQVDPDQQAVVGFASGTSGGVPTVEEVATEAAQQRQDLGVGNELVSQQQPPTGSAPVNGQQQSTTGQTQAEVQSPVNPHDDRKNPNLRMSDAPATGAYRTGDATNTKIIPPMEVVQEIYNTYAPRLEEARRRKFPEGYPGPDVVPEEPPADIWADDIYTSIIIRPETWQRFFNQTTQFGYGGTDLVEYVWWACSNIQNYRISLEELMVPLANWARRTDKTLKARVDENWRRLGRIMMYVSNREFQVDGKTTGLNGPGLCDSPGGFLAAPTPEQWKTSKKNRDELKNMFLKKMLDYKELAPREILLTDHLFIDAFSMIVSAQRAMMTWLTDDFTPLIRDINAKCCSKRDLLANINMRPAGLWDRKTMGYKSYWHEKYGKIYRYIPPDFSYWRSWDNKKIERIPEMLETLIYATHATAAGITRGALAFATEVFVDLSGKVWSLGQYAGLPDPDFGYAGGAKYKGAKKAVTFTLSPKFMLGAAERGNTHFMYGEVYPATPPVGIEFWDDAAEMEKNKWRDKELDKLKQDRDLFDREKEAEPETAQLSGLSTGANTPRPAKSGTSKKIGKGTQYRAVKKTIW
ncbi:hypothetical protein TWF718_009746 [Orbilia javanica]|uniref:Uncharacterized protein n=1 Tax=Orbilia javanica TaxID=47235 RepID=A0AAN8RLN1_9PEZI